MFGLVLPYQLSSEDALIIADLMCTLEQGMREALKYLLRDWMKNCLLKNNKAVTFENKL